MINAIKAIREKYNLQLAGLHELWDEVKAAEKPFELTPEQLKDTILSILQTADNNKSEYEEMLKAIQVYYPSVKGGPAGEIGTVTWAIDELLSQKLIAYFGGTTYGLPEVPSVEAKPSLDELMKKQLGTVAEMYGKVTKADHEKGRQDHRVQETPEVSQGLAARDNEPAPFGSSQGKPAL